jgi:hypothetical protein
MASNGDGAGTAVAGFLGLGAVGLFAEALSLTQLSLQR